MKGIDVTIIIEEFDELASIEGYASRIKKEMSEIRGPFDILLKKCYVTGRNEHKEDGYRKVIMRLSAIDCNLGDTNDK